MVALFLARLVPSQDRSAAFGFQFMLLNLGIGLGGLIGALAPEVEYDSLWYHLWLPKLWLEAGRPVDMVEEYISLWPMTWPSAVPRV